MLFTMPPSSPPLPPAIFSFSYQPTVPSPLRSSPIRASQSSPPPAAPRDSNTTPASRPVFNSSPLRASQDDASTQAPKWFKYANRDAKKNPLRQTRESAQESRRRLFFKNVKQRGDDKAWERRGGDQEVLKLEWSALDRRRRQQMDTDLDGLVSVDEELDDVSKVPEENSPRPDDLNAVDDMDDMMVDTHAQEEEAELDAMLTMYEQQSSQLPQSHERPESPALSDDDDYDSLFMNLISQGQREQCEGSHNIVLSGQMDMS